MSLWDNIANSSPVNFVTNTLDTIGDGISGFGTGFQNAKEGYESGGAAGAWNAVLRSGNSSAQQFTNYVTNELPAQATMAAQETYNECKDDLTGGIVGIDENNISKVTDAIEKMIDSVNQVLAGFDENASLDNAIKGEVQTATVEYITAVKAYLLAFVTQYRKFNDLLKESFANLRTGYDDLSSSIKSEAANIQQEAKNIQVN